MATTISRFAQASGIMLNLIATAMARGTFCLGSTVIGLEGDLEELGKEEGSATGSY
jgi:hypothetical protein